MHILFTLACLSSAPSDVPDLAGPWRASLRSPGGPLPFGLVLEQRDTESADGRVPLDATIVNGPERIDVDAWAEDGSLVVDLPHYDARIEAIRRPDGTLAGTWRKQKAESVDELAFSAVPGEGPRFASGDPPDGDIGGRWRVAFASSDDPAVALFDAEPDGVVTGTFLTSLGDYRYLAGRSSGAQIRLSVFDGSHAFLFHAQRQADGSLAGDFWSGASWHEAWTAVRDSEAALPDAFALTQWRDDASLDAITFPDLDGTPRRLSDPAFAGRARILQVFGSWCPNCADETAFLVELKQRYGPRGLSILGLAFEYTPDATRSARQVRRFQARHGADWPVLVAGIADKAEASRRLPILDRVRAYPTTVFLHRDGRVRAVHTGFAGPAAPEEHAAVRAEFVAILEELLAEAP